MDLVELVRRTVEDQRSVFDRNGVEFGVHLPAERVWVSCDPTRIAQVIGNLLQNALPSFGGGESVSGREDT